MGGGVKKADTWMPFYVTDYLGDTMHLTTVQHGAYLLLLLACWKSGGELADDDATLATITRLSAADWRKHGATLRAFFKSDGERLTHVRVLAELEKAQKLSDARSESGKKGGRPPKEKQEETNRFPDALANDKQTETPSPSPTSSLRSEVRRASALPCPNGVTEQTWRDWLALRKAKRAPVTETVVDGAAAEAMKASMTLDAFLRVWCTRGTQGLQADWLKPNERGQQTVTPREQAARERFDRMTGGILKVNQGAKNDVIDIAANLPALG